MTDLTPENCRIGIPFSGAQLGAPACGVRRSLIGAIGPVGPTPSTPSAEAERTAALGHRDSAFFGHSGTKAAWRIVAGGYSGDLVEELDQIA